MGGSMNKTAKEKIIEVLNFRRTSWLAVHEIADIIFRNPQERMVSQNAIASRLAELAKDRKVIGKYRENESYKEWTIVLRPISCEHAVVIDHIGDEGAPVYKCKNEESEFVNKAPLNKEDCFTCQQLELSDSRIEIDEDRAIREDGLEAQDD